MIRKNIETKKLFKMQQKTHFCHSTGGNSLSQAADTISVSVSSATTSHQVCMNGVKQQKTQPDKHKKQATKFIPNCTPQANAN